MELDQMATTFGFTAAEGSDFGNLQQLQRAMGVFEQSIVDWRNQLGS